MVAYHAAEQTVVGGVDIVVVVEHDGGEGGGVHTVYLRVVYLGDERGVQGVYALDDKHLVGLQTQLLAAHLGLTSHEVVAWQLHLLAFDEVGEVLVEELEVERIERLEVVLAVLILGRRLAVEEVVVEGDANGPHAVGDELHGESLARRGLAAGGRTGDEHYLYVMARLDVVSHAHELLVLQGLEDVYHVVGMAGEDGFVQVAHGAYAHLLLPVVILLEHLEHLVLLDERGEFCRLAALRHTEQQTVGEHLQAEGGEQTGACEHGTVVVVRVVVEGIEGGVHLAETLYEVHLGGLAALFESLYHVLGGLLVAVDVVVGSYYLLHLLAYVVGIVGGDVATEEKTAEVTVADGELYLDARIGVQVAHGLAEYHVERLGVGAHACRGGDVEELQRLVAEEAVVKAHYAVIDLHHHRRQGHIEVKQGQHVGNLTADLGFYRLAVVAAAHIDEFLFHVYRRLVIRLQIYE